MNKEWFFNNRKTNIKPKQWLITEEIELSTRVILAFIKKG
jgi:hypothetical protein